MIKKLFSLFAIATLASFSTYANEEVTNAVIITEEVIAVEKTDLLAADEVLLEEVIVADEAKTELADGSGGCGCGCKPKKDCKKDDEDNLLAGCSSCKKKNKGGNETDVVVEGEAPKQLLANNTVASDEILPTDEAEEQLA